MGKKQTRRLNYNEVMLETQVSNSIDQRNEKDVKFGKKVKIKCRNESQKIFIRMIDNNDIIICNGPAGCGKSHLSLNKALDLIQIENNGYKKIQIITPSVEITRNGVGFLPGDFNDKMRFYMNSVYNLIDKSIGEKRREELIKENIIEALGVAYIRGENIDHSILIVEEAQNLSKKEILTILTRIGENAKIIISGDIMQTDAFKNKEESGLYHAMNTLKNIKGIGLFEFTDEDIVRHPLISLILEKYKL